MIPDPVNSARHIYHSHNLEGIPPLIALPWPMEIDFAKITFFYHFYPEIYETDSHKLKLEYHHDVIITHLILCYKIKRLAVF